MANQEADQKESPKTKAPDRKGELTKTPSTPVLEQSPEPPEAGKLVKPKSVLTVEKGYNTYYTYSGKASDITRQLGLAGIAIIWIFKITDGGREVVPRELWLPGLLLIIGLALDLLHYVVSAAFWYFFTARMEKQGIEEFRAPKKINWPGTAFFILKIIAVVVAYIFLIRYLAARVT